MRIPRRQAGISFVELVMFIIVVSVGIVGILSVINYNTSKSADPMIRKQALAIAESLLEEIEMQPFCDPDLLVATSSGEEICPVMDAIGPEAGEVRADASTPFDNVNDYVTANGVEKTIDIVDISDNSAIEGLAGYKAYVTIKSESLNGVPVEDSLRIDVRVTGPAGVEVRLTGYRLRYAPNSV